MEIKQNPFSLYDFLGYFVPGALFLVGLAAIQLVSNPSITIADNVINWLHLDKVGFYLPFILIAYLVGHTISFISSVTLENYSNWKVGFPSKYLLGEPRPNYFASTAKKYGKTRMLMHCLVGGFLLPITILDLSIGNLFHFDKLLYARPLEPHLIEILKGKLKLLAQNNTGLSSKMVQENELGDFRFAYHYAVEHAPAHLPKMQNYVALYGFTRTITMVIVLLFWWFLAMFIRGNISFWAYLPILAFLSAFSFISYLDFMKFYRRFSLEVMMAVSVTLSHSDQKEHEGKKETYHV
jgi:hypothetical protein